jgi:hypothetical protein
MTSIGRIVCDVAFHFLEVVVVSDADPPVAPESTGASYHAAQSHAPTPLHADQAHVPESSCFCLPIL